MTTRNKGYCLIITPYNSWFNDYCENIYKPAIRTAGLAAIRADDIYHQGEIVDDIRELIRESEILLADLTDKNPNVLYELGLGHALGKPAVLMSERVDDIPFNLRSLRVIICDYI